MKLFILISYLKKCQTGGGCDITSPQLIKILFPSGTFQCKLRALIELLTLISAINNFAGIDANAAAPNHATH